MYQGSEMRDLKESMKPENVWKSISEKAMEGADEFDSHIPADADQSKPENWPLEKLLAEEGK